MSLMRIEKNYGPISLYIEQKENSYFLVCCIDGQKKECLITGQIEQLLRETKAAVLKSKEENK